jgi:hypothetical protein
METRHNVQSQIVLPKSLPFCLTHIMFSSCLRAIQAFICPHALQQKAACRITPATGEDPSVQAAMEEEYDSDSDVEFEDQSMQGALSSRSGLAQSVGMSAS